MTDWLVKILIWGIGLTLVAYGLKWMAISPVCESAAAIQTYVDVETTANNTILVSPSPSSRLPVRPVDSADEPTTGQRYVIIGCQAIQIFTRLPNPIELIKQIQI